MATHPSRSPHPSRVDEAEEGGDPAMLPVTPDEGPIAPAIPADPEHDRVVDPEA